MRHDFLRSYDCLFFYIARSIKKQDRSLINYSLKASYFGDAMIFLIVLIQFITAYQLVSIGNFTLAVPWIFVVYVAFSTVILLWLTIFLLKFFYLTKENISTIAIKFFYWLNIMIILIFIIIIHDAVTQSTWFDFLIRK